ncbi:MAG: SH3 domain-containing protein [Spirochaetia bacterium]
MTRKTIVIALIFSFLLLYACEDEQELPQTLDLPPTPVLSIQVNWAIVDVPYIRLRSEPIPGASTIDWLQQGEIVEILSKTSTTTEFEGESDYWYQLNYEGIHGWAFGSFLEIYESREQAVHQNGE